MKVKQRQLFLLLGVGLLAVWLVTSGTISSFTTPELMPLQVNQNGYNLVLDAHSFLSTENITGSILVPVGTNWPPENYTWSGTQFRQTSIGIYLNDIYSGSLELPYNSFCPTGYACFASNIAEEYRGPANVEWNLTNNQAQSIPCSGSGCPIYSSLFKKMISHQVPNSIRDVGGNQDLKLVKQSDIYECFQSSCPSNLTMFLGTDQYTTSTYNMAGQTVTRATASNGTHFFRQDILHSNIYLEPSACTDPSMVTYEVAFRGGTTLRVNPESANETGLGIMNPVFCHSAPLLKMYSDSNQVFEQSVQEYDSLRAGGYVTVPENQLWILFYRGQPNTNNILLCSDNGGVWNQSTNTCELPPTLVYICHGVQQETPICISQATDYRCQDPSAVLETEPDGTLVCRVYLSSTETCSDPSAVLETEPDGTFVCRVYLSSTATCSDPSAVLVEENGESICRLYFDVTETTYSCPTGYTLVTLANGQHACDTQPELQTTYSCPTGYTLVTLANGQHACDTQPQLQTTFNCPAGAELKQNSNGVHYCEYQPELICAGTLTDGQCVVIQDPVIGQIGSTLGSINYGIILIVLVVAGVFVLWFAKKR